MRNALGISGAYSTAYLQRLKSIIEETDWSNEFCGTANFLEGKTLD